MSAEHLRQAIASDALKSTPPRSGLAELHLPFDQLHGEEVVEGRLVRELQARERIGVVGPSGSGKSSAAAYLGNANATELAMITVPLTMLSDDELPEPGTVLEHLIQQLRASVDGSDTREIHMTSASVSAGPSWLTVELAAEIREQVAVEPDSLPGLLDTLRQVLRGIEASGGRPVLVFDDTDRWVGRAGFDDPARQREAFFMRTLRAVMDELDCAMLVAAHDTYRGTDLLDGLGVLVDVPKMRSGGQLRRLLDHRLEVADAGCCAADLLEGGAVNALYEYYMSDAQHSVRNVIQVVKQAAQETLNAGHGRVSGMAIVAAIRG